LNRSLADGLPADKTVLPHPRLGRQAPGPFLLQHKPEGQRGGPIQTLDALHWFEYDADPSMVNF